MDWDKVKASLKGLSEAQLRLIIQAAWWELSVDKWQLSVDKRELLVKLIDGMVKANSLKGV